MEEYLIANYHTHTVRCGHAQGSERDYIESAIRAGIGTLGFSDHAPYCFARPGYYSGWRMEPGQAPDYFATLRALREEYRGRIRILIGLEMEYYPKSFAATLDFVNRFAPDYLILGQHALNDEYDGVASYPPTDSEELLAQYVNQVCDGLKTGKFLYLAHPDVFHFVGDNAVYRRHMGKLCRFCRESDLPLEINMLGIADKRHYPSERFFSIAGEEGCDAVIGVDAHQPAALADVASYRAACTMAQRCGLHIRRTLL